jgi:hypothetical protein
MTVEKKVKVTPADAYPLGKNPDNGPASMYTGFKYPTGGGNDIGVYKQPMENPVSSTAKEVTMRDFTNKKSAYEVGIADPAMTVSVGYDDKIDARGKGEMRGYGAATKGRKISGKMG